MFIAKNEELRRTVRGTQVREDYCATVESKLVCQICEKPVEYDPGANHLFQYFTHRDGSPDCFDSDGASASHRLGVEVAVEAMHNRLAEVTGEPVEIDVERWVGSPQKFVITDVKVLTPLRVSAEIFYRADELALRRRLSDLSKHDYRTFLIFCTDGVHEHNKVQKYIHRISSLDVGWFDPEMMDITLGDLFSQEQIDFSQGPRVPEYILHSP